MKALKDILKERIVDYLASTIVVDSVDGLIVYVCNTSYLRVGSVVTDGADISYKVTDISPNEWIQVDDEGFTGNINLKPVLFLEGTPISTNNEYLQISNYSEDKLPLIWLVQNYRERNYGEHDTREREVTCTILFLDTYNRDWINDQIKDNSLRAMYSLMGQFTQRLQDDFQYFNGLEVFDTVPRARFGVETTKGTESLIINDFLSGVELSMTFTINKLENCNDCLVSNNPCLPSFVTVTNSDASYLLQQSIPSGQNTTITLPDTVINIFMNNTLEETVITPTLG